MHLDLQLPSVTAKFFEIKVIILIRKVRFFAVCCLTVGIYSLAEQPNDDL